ncbi:MAG: homoserine O-succinyltransferase [Clostridia bacterium]|nr:homoserine O-succinyltransferase [Clostridia bacterium]
MPIKIPVGLPAAETLEKENIFVMDENRASRQDIRPLKIAILNLMPTKIVTETQLLRLLSNTPLQTDITLLTTGTYSPKNVPEGHLASFYKTFNDVKDERFDGFIITGAPVEYMEFEEVSYWDELCDIMEWTKHNVFSTMFICWGAMAGLYYKYGIKKLQLDKKMFGVFKHKTLVPSHPLLRGFDEEFLAPHSRFSYCDGEAFDRCPSLIKLAESDEAGLYLAASSDGRSIFVIGHGEYDAETLKTEYLRDLSKGKEIEIPRHYFNGDDPNSVPVNTWRAHAHLLFSNWLNYFVYQNTPFNLNEMPLNFVKADN